MSHPLLVSLEGNMTKEQIKHMRTYLEAVTSSLPVEMIYSDYSTAPRSIIQACELEESEILKKLQTISDALFEGKEFNGGLFLDVLHSMPEFRDRKEFLDEFVKGKSSGNA